MTGQGGWPLNVFLTPEQVPVLRRHLLPAGARAAAGRRGARCCSPSPTPGTSAATRSAPTPRASRARCAAARAAPGGRTRSAASCSSARSRTCRRPSTRSTAAGAARRSSRAASAIEFLLARGERAMSLQTLRSMASGGIYDQVGGGFARYSVDARWTVPHFEKMLYDNALLARAYLHGWLASGDALLRRTCEETLDWALREMRARRRRLLQLARRRQRGRRGQVLRLDGRRAGRRARAGLRRRAGLARRERRGQLPRGRAGLERARVARSRARRRDARADPRAPARGPRAARAAGDRRQAPHELERAADQRARRRRRGARPRGLPRRRRARPPDFLLTSRCATPDGRLLRTFNQGRAKQRAFLEDHAFLLEALIALYEATFEERWFIAARRARGRADRALRRSRERRLLLDRGRRRAADRAAQGARGPADPLRGRRARRSACCASRC